MNIELYIDEILNQINAANQALDSSNDLFTNHHRFLIHCTVIHKILFPSKHLLRKEEKNIALEREDEFKKYFSECQEINNNTDIQKFRNHFEHLDTRMDKYFNRDKKLVVDKNISDRDLGDYIKIGGQPLSNEVSNEDKFRNFEAGKLTFMGESFDTNVAKKWIDAIKNYIILKRQNT